MAKLNTPYHKINKNSYSEVLKALGVSRDKDKTIMRIAMYAKYKFTYRSDQSLFGKIDYWQSAEEMFYNEEGDCDDYASFILAALRHAGISSASGHIVWSRSPGLFVHAIVVVSFKGGWAVLDSSDEVIHSGFSSKEKAINGSLNTFGYVTNGGTPTDYPNYSYPSDKPELFRSAPRLKMHAHLTECEPNQVELMIPTINDEADYSALENKEGVGVLIKTRKNSLHLKAAGISFTMHGWYSPSIEYNDQMYTAHFLFPHIGINVYTGDYEGIDIDVNPVFLKWLKVYIACRNFEVWDYKGVLSPFKFIDAVAEINDGFLTYGVFLNFFEEKNSYVSAGYNNEKEISLAVKLLNPDREIKMSIGSHFRIEIGFGW